VILDLCMDSWLKGEGNFDRCTADLKIFPTMVTLNYWNIMSAAHTWINILTRSCTLIL